MIFQLGNFLSVMNQTFSCRILDSISASYWFLVAQITFLRWCSATWRPNSNFTVRTLVADGLDWHLRCFVAYIWAGEGGRQLDAPHSLLNGTMAPVQCRRENSIFVAIGFLFSYRSCERTSSRSRLFIVLMVPKLTKSRLNLKCIERVFWKKSRNYHFIAPTY